MRVISFNANGLRSATRKGFFSWFSRQRADVLCVQELKAQAAQLQESAYHQKGFHRTLFEARRPGYSGVAIYSRSRPKKIIKGLGEEEFDAEGRYLEVIFEKIAVVSVYLPSGSSGEMRQQAKFRFLDFFEKHLAKLRRRRLPYILCGDFNIAHKAIDLRNWRPNQKNSGFLPEERDWMERVLEKVGFVDAFRAINQNPDQYTWWSNRGRAREKNVGWRIDYQLVSPELREHIRRVSVYKKKWFSDHAPLIIDYDF